MIIEFIAHVIIIADSQSCPWACYMHACQGIADVIGGCILYRSRVLTPDAVTDRSYCGISMEHTDTMTVEWAHAHKISFHAESVSIHIITICIVLILS